jgi:hypothetical protein
MTDTEIMKFFFFLTGNLLQSGAKFPPKIEYWQLWIFKVWGLKYQKLDF